MPQDTRASERPVSEDGAGMAIDEENLGERFQDQDLEHLLADAAGSHMTTESTAFLPQTAPGKRPARQLPGAKSRPKWMKETLEEGEGLEEDDDVPESLLLDGHKGRGLSRENRDRRRLGAELDSLPPPVPGPSTRSTRAQWEATRAQQRLHEDNTERALPKVPSLGVHSHLALTNPRDRAMWRWLQVQNLDKFLNEVYYYYYNHGMWSILLARLIMLLRTAFVVGFMTFLSFCIDWKALPHSKRMPEVIVPQCTQKIHGLWNIALWLSSFFWICTLFRYIYEIPQLWQMHNFYRHVLEIPDSDIQTVSWQYIVQRLMTLRDANPATNQTLSNARRTWLGTQSKQRMDAHDIANRLMRRDNYLIALFNKDILDLTVPVPFFGNVKYFSKTTEWNIQQCVLDFVFDDNGQVRTAFLDTKYRRQLIESLNRRFVFAGAVSIVTGPASVVFFCISYFFRYFTSFQKEPSKLSSRAFTPLADWHFREFNELPHFYQRRKMMATPYADQYLQQFPKDKIEQISHFVAFVSGALAAVLALASFWDSELFLGFELTPGKTVLFWLGVLTPIYLAARSSTSEDTVVMDPEYALEGVLQFMHHSPAHWQDRLHTDEVRKEFSAMYQMKVLIFAEELLSMIFTPLVLIYSLPRSSERIIDFFREFTIHVDGVGHVCSFAVFNFKRPGGPKPRAIQQGHDTEGLREDYYSTKGGKMAASTYGFIDTYGPNPTAHGRSASLANLHASVAFPGGASPMLVAQPGLPGARLSNLRHSIYQMHRPGPARGEALPMHSVLLDPHHQPSMSALRTSPRQAPRTRQRSRRRPLAEADELDEELEAGPSAQQHPISVSNAVDEEDGLGDSWRTTRAAQSGGNHEDEDTDTGDGGKGAGVLGMLYQFQKAQTDGRGVGV
ncbi:hypothetical protein W97_03091 [Coniosporium apollinis CBS 100218]|uniref:Autophagy-related protein 9 n=1 Tax=Coniosporium apollinis (strain CBS 100218) TaxID=1168221 RepID=R7YPT8_CONA1|nr:uncharacterized protein W97_03091 [Coniosporium apollinis CBS 100218]EON63863.1 hypothetical protein W97_03091 [Coniosporium apollinis CBS 100218]